MNVQAANKSLLKLAVAKGTVNEESNLVNQDDLSEEKKPSSKFEVYLVDIKAVSIGISPLVTLNEDTLGSRGAVYDNEHFFDPSDKLKSIEYPVAERRIALPSAIKWTSTYTRFQSSQNVREKADRRGFKGIKVVAQQRTSIDLQKEGWMVDKFENFRV